MKNIKSVNPEDILDILRGYGDKTLTEIKEKLLINPTGPNVLYHLKRLMEQGKVVKNGLKYGFNNSGVVDLIKINCYGKVQAGTDGKFNDDDAKYQIAIPTKFTQGQNSENLFIMEIDGDSMEPFLNKGNLVLCRYFINGENPKDDDVSVFKLNDGELKIKRFKKINSDYILWSDNYTKYGPIPIDENTYAIGKLISVIK